jgi:DinB superfamily
LRVAFLLNIKLFNMNSLKWFERKFSFGLPKEMLPFYLERLEGTPARIENKIRAVNDVILSEKYGGKWSVKQHIGHLAEVDLVANRRIDEIISGVAELSPAVFEPKDYSLWSLDDVLDYFQNIRAGNISKYASLKEEDLSKSSIHPRLKTPMTVVDLAWFDAEHDDHHLVAITEILKANSHL